MSVPTYQKPTEGQSAAEIEENRAAVRKHIALREQSAALGFGRKRSPVGVAPNPGYVNTKQIALDLGVTQRRAQQLCAWGEIRAVRIYGTGLGCRGSSRGYWRVKVEDYALYLEKLWGGGENAERIIGIIDRLLGSISKAS